MDPTPEAAHGPDVAIRDFKPARLKGATLVAGLPNMGVGGILVTDYLLAQGEMDHVASADSDLFPPVAMVHGGRPRFPIRIHADAKATLAVLRSEIPAHPRLVRPLARATVAWARRAGAARIVALDAVGADGSDDGTLLFATDDPAERDRLLARGLRPLEAGVLGGFPACLLLESRLQGFPVTAVLAPIRSAEDDVHSGLRFADELSAWLPNLRIDRKALEGQLRDLEGTIRNLQRQAERALSPQPDTREDQFV